MQKRRIVQFQQNFNRKERKEHRDKNLWRFFFAIFVFFAVNSFLLAACRAAVQSTRIAHFWQNFCPSSFPSFASVKFFWLRLCRAAPWRLCVERSFLSVESAPPSWRKQLCCSNLSVVKYLRLRLRRSVLRSLLFKSLGPYWLLFKFLLHSAFCILHFAFPEKALDKN